MSFVATTRGTFAGVLLALGALALLAPAGPLFAQTAPAPAAEAPATISATGPATAPASTEPAALYQILPSTQPGAATLGSTDSASGFKLQVDLTAWGAGLKAIALTDYHEAALNQTPYVIQPNEKDAAGLYRGYAVAGNRIYPYAALAVWIDGQRVDLRDVEWTLAPQAPANHAVYLATVADPAGKAVVRLTRDFSLARGSYELVCRQRIENLDHQKHQIVWEQYLQGDMPAEPSAYVGDQRKFVAGYHDLSYDPQRVEIYTKNGESLRAALLDDKPFWPNPSLPARRDLVWLAATNRYFATVTYAPLPAAATQPGVPALDQAFDTVGHTVLGAKGPPTDTRTLILTLKSRPVDLAPGASSAGSLDLALYAGPLDSAVFNQPAFAALHLSDLVVYNLGGMCAFCTFQWLANLLLGFLKGIHFVVRDWGVAIIILVLCVRGLLHPITRRSQIGMTKMQKQMATLQPEIEKIKKKYADDAQKIQAETMKLYREKGINPANMLGCLPMFLQTPIWIALFAVLYFAIELRHQPAFYGVFQALTGGQWQFLADLSSPDSFIPLGAGFVVPWLGWHVTAINLLPILMAAVFFIQQRYTSPPPTNEQAAQQQKIMMFTTLLFPLFMYKAPSGLTLYMMASTAAGIGDSYLVKRHIKKEEAAGTFLQNTSRKTGGWMDRIMRIMEERGRALGGGGRGKQRRR